MVNERPECCPNCGVCDLDWNPANLRCRSCNYDGAASAILQPPAQTSPTDPTLKWRDLVALGTKMRQAQKNYFRTRDRTDLIVSKGLESEFDRRAAAMLGQVDGPLFKGGG